VVVDGRSTRSLGCMNAEFIEPTSASRRKLAILFVVSLVGGVLLIELLEAYLAELKLRPICETIGPVSVLWISVLGGLLLCAAWAAWTARKTLKLNQWPLPGTWVFRRTLIRRGRPVIWGAYAMLAWAILVVAAVIFASYVSWDLMHRVDARCGARVSMQPNNALERTVRHRGPRLAAARRSWPAAQLGR
jgi:FtsH-binding integral membrane protein